MTMTSKRTDSHHQLSALSEECLESLGRYTFLTAEQCQLTVSSTSTTRVRRVLKDLAHLGFAGVLAQKRLTGRKFVYYLTQRGANTLASLTRLPLGAFHFKSDRTVSLSTDYEHRCLTVSAHIAITQTLEREAIETPAGSIRMAIDSWHTYFNAQGANRNAKATKSPLRPESRIDLPDGSVLIPDVIFVLADKSCPKSRMLAVLEVTRGQDAGRVMAQVEAHMKAMTFGSIPEKCGIPARYCVLFLCEKETLFGAVQKRFLALRNAESFSSSFLFASLEDFFLSPIHSWRTASEPEKRVSFITGESSSDPQQGPSTLPRAKLEEAKKA